ncbi:MAG: hypothetical protein NXH70_02045 [Hyphomonas sp.]|nr:hypothetical protein [Hyphomonas sp.]
MQPIDYVKAQDLILNLQNTEIELANVVAIRDEAVETIPGLKTRIEYLRAEVRSVLSPILVEDEPEIEQPELTFEAEETPEEPEVVAVEEDVPEPVIEPVIEDVAEAPVVEEAPAAEAVPEPVIEPAPVEEVAEVEETAAQVIEEPVAEVAEEAPAEVIEELPVETLISEEVVAVEDVAEVEEATPVAEEAEADELYEFVDAAEETTAAGEMLAEMDGVEIAAEELAVEVETEAAVVEEPIAEAPVEVAPVIEPVEVEEVPTETAVEEVPVTEVVTEETPVEVEEVPVSTYDGDPGNGTEEMISFGLFPMAPYDYNREFHPILTSQDGMNFTYENVTLDAEDITFRMLPAQGTSGGLRFENQRHRGWRDGEYETVVSTPIMKPGMVATPLALTSEGGEAFGYTGDNDHKFAIELLGSGIVRFVLKNEDQSHVLASTTYPWGNKELFCSIVRHKHTTEVYFEVFDLDNSVTVLEGAFDKTLIAADLKWPLDVPMHPEIIYTIDRQRWSGDDPTAYDFTHRGYGIMKTPTHNPAV